MIGVDVARFGDDKSALFFRHGRDGTPRPYERYAGLDTMALAAKVAERIGTWDPDAVFVDEGGVGGGVVDRLHQLGFRRVIGVNFGGKADRGGTGSGAGNKRSEMWLSARDWLQRGVAAEGRAARGRADRTDVQLQRRQRADARAQGRHEAARHSLAGRGRRLRADLRLQRRALGGARTSRCRTTAAPR